MALGQLLADVLYFAGLLLLLAVSIWTGNTTWEALRGTALPAALAVSVSLLVGLLSWMVVIAVLHLPLRRPPPGRHAMLKSAGFYVWFLSFLVRRYLSIHPIFTLVLHSHVLRFVIYRALGARIHFTTNMSGDVLVLDPALFEAGPGCVLGSGVMVAGHLIADGRLILAPVRLGARVEVGARSGLSPGVSVGDGTRIGIMVSVGPNTRIGKDCVFDHHVTVDAHCSVGDGARILACTYVPPGTDIPAHCIWSAQDSALLDA